MKNIRTELLDSQRCKIIMESDTIEVDVIASHYIIPSDDDREVRNDLHCTSDQIREDCKCATSKSGGSVNVEEEEEEQQQEKQIQQQNRLSPFRSPIVVEDGSVEWSLSTYSSFSDLEDGSPRRRVHFYEHLVSEVHERPRTPPEESSILYYSKKEFERFWEEYDSDDEQELTEKNETEDNSPVQEILF